MLRRNGILVGHFKSKDGAAKRIMQIESHYPEWAYRLENPEQLEFGMQPITLDEMLERPYLNRHYKYKEVELHE